MSFYAQPDNYEKLLKGELGDNLMRKYETNVFLTGYIALMNLAYSLLQTKCPKEVWPSLQAARDWALACRNVSLVFKDASFIKKKSIVSLKYDVGAWYKNDSSKPLIQHKKVVTYTIYYDVDYIDNIIRQAETLYGKDKTFVIAKTLNTYRIQELWAKCDNLA
jgi:hypothetical protein